MRLPNAFYAQSGGVTAVINASACGVIQTARQHANQIGTVYAGRHGIVGALTEDLIDTDAESAANIAALRHTPAGAFGSCRYKLNDVEQNRAQYERLIEVLRAHDIGYFFYNGGGDSQDTAWKVSEIAQQVGYAIACIGIPKTIDNDLPATDCCPGYGSAAKYIAVSTLEATFDLASMASTSTRVFVLEVMGRHTGWLAAAGGLIADAPYHLPVLIVTPERPLQPERLLAQVTNEVDRAGYCTIVVSEGIRDEGGQFLAEAGGKDAFGHTQLGGVAPLIAQLIKTQLALKTHWAVADYLQRSARHIASQTDVEQAYRVGCAAVELALAGHNAVMPTIVRCADEPYIWDIGHVALPQVANLERPLPADYLDTDGFRLSAAGRRYLLPLLQGEDYPPYRHGFPDYARLLNQAVPKRLGTPFQL